jgi:methionyl-tRNA formyltransferase
MRAKILLLGVGPTALSALESVAEACEVVAVVREAADGDPVAARAAELGVRHETDVSVSSVEQLVSDLTPDALVVSSYNRILRHSTLQQLPCVNVHYSPLPKYRGRANVNWALINGEPEVAISIHTMVPDLDAGNILYQQRIPIGPRDTVSILYDRLNDLQRASLADAVLRHLAGDPGRPQREEDATYGCSRNPEDGEIDWRASTANIDRLVRSLVYPFPGAFTYLNCRRLIVWRAEPVIDGPRYVGRVPGRVVHRSEADGSVDVLTGDGTLRLFDVESVDKEMQPAAAIIRSVRATLGLRPVDLLRRVEELEAKLGAVTSS